MKHVFSVSIKKTGNVNSFLNSVSIYQVVAPTAKHAIYKATKQFKLEEQWANGTVITQLIHRGPAV